MANVIYSVIPKEKRWRIPTGITKVRKLYCSKKDKFGKFFIIFNDRDDKKISLSYRHRYAKLLYDVVHHGKYEHGTKNGLDELIRRACGVTSGKKATFSKYLPELEFVNFLQRTDANVIENGDVELVPERS